MTDHPNLNRLISCYHSLGPLLEEDEEDGKKDDVDTQYGQDVPQGVLGELVEGFHQAGTSDEHYQLPQQPASPKVYQDLVTCLARGSGVRSRIEF